MPTVGSLAYQIVANTSNFTAGTVATKAELRTLKSAFLESQTPVERYSMAIAHLEDLAVRFPSKAAHIQATIAKMRTEMNDSQWKESAMGQILTRLPIAIDPVTAGLQAMHTAAGVARAGLAMLEQVAGAVVDRMGELDVLAKKSRTLGVDAGSLVGLRGAAEDISGVTAEAFDGAFTKFTRRIADAASSGKGGAFDALSRLGLSAKELSGMSPDQALLKIADAMQKIENPSERLKLSWQLLGNEGQELVTMLAAGGDEIRRVAERERELSQIDFLDLDAIERGNTAIANLEKQLGSIVSLLAADLAPLVTDVAGDLGSGFSNATDKGAKLRETIQLITFTTAALVDELEMLGNVVWAPLEPVLKLLENPVFQGLVLGGASSPMVKALTQPGDRLNALADAGFGPIKPTNPQTVAQIAQQEDAKAKIKEAADLAEKAQKTADAAAKAEKARQKQQIHDEAENARELEEKARKAEDAIIAQADKLFESTRTPAEKLRSDFEDLQRLNATGALSPELFGRGLGELRDRAVAIAGADVQKQSVGAIRAGSVEALRAQFDGQALDEKQLEEIKKGNADRAEGNKLLGEVRDAIKASKLVEAV